MKLVLKNTLVQKSKTVNIGDTFIACCGCPAVVVDYENRLKVIVEFQDSFRLRKCFTAQNLKRGDFKNPYTKSIFGVGYLGDGEFKSNSKVYVCWFNMLKRCYVTINQPTAYRGVTVSEVWHNFQNFASWYYSQQNCGDGYQLDKDLMTRGNTVYSPKTCCLIPREINNLIGNFSNVFEGDIVGCSLNKRDNLYAVTIRDGRKVIYSGYFKDQKEATKAYVAEKEKRVKVVASKWKDRIDEKVYIALMGWTVYSKNTNISWLNDEFEEKQIDK